MKNSFTFTAKLDINSKISSDLLTKLPEIIFNHTNLEFSYQQKANGCFLKPTFKNMPYRNSFVPELNITASSDNSQTTLCIIGQPVKLVRIFMFFWFSFLSLMEIFSLILIFTAKSSIVSALIPICMAVLGYFLCKLGTKATFNSVITAIKKDYL